MVIKNINCIYLCKYFKLTIFNTEKAEYYNTYINNTEYIQPETKCLIRTDEQIPSRGM